MSNQSPVSDLSRRQQFARTYQMAKQSDPRLGLWVLLAFLVAGAIGFAIFYFLPGPDLWFAIPGAILFGVLGALIIFGRRAQRAMYVQMEGQKGAAAGALQMLRRGWQTTPMVAFNKQQDVIHRVVGPPGIVLVAEGNPNRIKDLLAKEKRRHERVVSDIPIHEVVCGDGPDEVPLPKLVKHVSKLGRLVKPAELTDVLGRLKAVDSQRSNIPLPKGPVPTNMKGLRGNLRGR